jgi:L-cysteine S-thiosulfotransferase
MMRCWAAALMVAATTVGAQERSIPIDKLQSGRAFISAELRAQQDDDFANPGMLWVERGAKLWHFASGSHRKACADCHQDARVSMKGVAASYPAIDKASGKLFNTADRIMQCRTERQGMPRPAWESEEQLSLTAFVAHQSRGIPIRITINDTTRSHFEAGRAMFNRRIGQLNMSCAHCHDAQWGRTLFAETISQGHPTAYPVYRLDWQTIGSLERRLRACLSGIRAEMLPYGAPAYRDLELYLAWRAEGLVVETPGVRR